MTDFNDLQVCGQLYDCDFGLFNTLTVTVGTNGYQGGDSGHGGRTYISIEDTGCTDIEARASELDSIIEAFRWTADKLEETKNNK
jgi:hypothetical protein